MRIRLRLGDGEREVKCNVRPIKIYISYWLKTSLRYNTYESFQKFDSVSFRKHICIGIVQGIAWKSVNFITGNIHPSLAVFWMKTSMLNGNNVIFIGKMQYKQIVWYSESQSCNFWRMMQMVQCLMKINFRVFLISWLKNGYSVSISIFVAIMMEYHIWSFFHFCNKKIMHFHSSKTWRMVQYLMENKCQIGPSKMSKHKIRGNKNLFSGKIIKWKTRDKFDIETHIRWYVIRHSQDYGRFYQILCMLQQGLCLPS